MSQQQQQRPCQDIENGNHHEEIPLNRLNSTQEVQRRDRIRRIFEMVFII